MCAQLKAPALPLREWPSGGRSRKAHSSCALSPTATRNPTLAALQLSFFAAR